MNEEEKTPFSINAGVIDPKAANKSAERDPEMTCGLGRCRPKGLQACTRMGTFVGVYSISGLMTSVLGMYIVSQITTIEKQFGFSSSQSGFLLSCNDIGFLLTTMFASYAARKVHIPRVLWFSSVLYGVGGLVCACAYFVSKDVFKKQVEHLVNGTYSNVSNSDPASQMPHFKSAPLCLGGVNASKCDEDDGGFKIGLPNKYSQIAMILIAFGMILQGIGKSPRYPFLATYVDDNGKKKNTAMYMGIITGVGIFGPAIAFSLGAVFSQIYVTLEDVSLHPRHPSWIGAWWLGFVIFGIISVLTSFPLVFFPRRMKPKPVRGDKPKQEIRNGFCNYIVGFLKAILRLVKNRVYILLLCNQCIVLFGVAGMVAFSAKYLETQFFLPTWLANILIGGMSVVSASLGTVIGGLVVTKRQLSPVGCIKMLIGISLTSSIIVATGYVFGCGNAHIVGLSDKRTDDNQTCVVDCHCDSTKYFPVCGSNGKNYLSPCVAGCKQEHGNMYSECGCVTGSNATVVPGLCDTDCKMLYPYLAMTVVGNFLGTMSIIPGFIASIRSVSEQDKSMAVGLGSLFSTLFGWFLGPVVFGRIIDSTCMLWATSCTSTGACALYDNDRLRIAKTTLEFAPWVIIVLLYILTLHLAKKQTDWSVDEVFNKGDNTIEIADAKGVNCDVTKSLIKPEKLK